MSKMSQKELIDTQWSENQKSLESLYQNIRNVTCALNKFCDEMDNTGTRGQGSKMSDEIQHFSFLFNIF